ncbi:hypothetical protein EYC80_001665 [Monilinia laxa]|uniref:Transcription initiation factor IIA subunit 2 n=1 Tax=Monilinia laxa TaxID=61186 RepID=A0A5N6K5Q6_MONLA|nr:hypothetical protein EYC80_001665 [Monilinia laxa]
MAAPQSFYELYRRSSIGMALTDTLDDLISERRIEPQLAMKILANFDRSITEVLADKVKARLTFKGHLDTYRFCDEVWTFLIKDVTFKMENSSQSVTADKVKIVSCNSKKPGRIIESDFCDGEEWYLQTGLFDHFRKGIFWAFIGFCGVLWHLSREWGKLCYLAPPHHARVIFDQNMKW